MMRIASVVFGLLALVLLGYAGYQYATDRDSSPEPAIVVREPNQDVGPHLCGTAVSVRFLVTNPSSQPVRVLGLAGA